MKKFIFFIVLLSQVFYAQSPFDKANLLYKKGQYQEAISEYEYVFRSKKHSSELYYNLGNCYYKLNKVAPAIYNFEKALLLNPEDAEIQNNLRFAQKRTIDDIKVVPKVGFSRILDEFTAKHHYDVWAWFAVGFSGFFLLLFLAFYFSKATLPKRLFFTAMIFSFLAALSCVAIAISAKNTFDNDIPAIVFAESMPVKTEPKSDAPDSFVLHEGAKVFVIQSLDSWIKIELTDGKKGWVLQNNIRMLK